MLSKLKLLILTNKDIQDMVLELTNTNFFFLSETSGFDKNVTIFGADMSLSGHVDNRVKDILILGKNLT